MLERKVTVGSASGLHARPARLFVEEAGRHPVPVLIGVTGGDGGDDEDVRLVPAHSMLGVLSLGATRGTEVVLRAEGDGAEAALAALAGLLSSDLDATAESEADRVAEARAEAEAEEPADA